MQKQVISSKIKRVFSNMYLTDNISEPPYKMNVKFIAVNNFEKLENLVQCLIYLLIFDSLKRYIID